MMDSSNSSSIIFSCFIGIGLSLIALITAFGNIIVLLAFYCDKKLRTVNDYFILNMAIADFLVGFFCIPFYIPFSLTRFWPFGELFCKIWVTIDDVATMASVINIVAISINRYWSIAYPLTYRKCVNQNLVYLVMIGVWCLSFINFAPGIWLMSLFDKGINVTNTTRSDCEGDYNNSFVYMLVAQFNYFIWPFIFLCVFNILIMLNIWKRSRKMSRLIACNQYTKGKDKNIGSSLLGTSNLEDDQHLSTVSKYHIHSSERYSSMIFKDNENIVPTSSSNKSFQYLCTQSNNKSSNISQHSVTTTREKSSNLIDSSRNRSVYINELTDNGLSSPIIESNRKSINVNFSSSRHCRNDSYIEYQIENEVNISRSNLTDISSSNRSQPKSRDYCPKRSRIARDRKAARSLFVLVIVFLIFLFPYVICATASTAGLTISKNISEISFWLLWMNSTFNPLLYPFIQIKYRRAYIQLYQSCLQCFSSSRSNRSL
ncbi:unnamed protein product [Adineta steineri]|uniref:G-protein coupled receptors family 1 profile domain-containing protein n=1 Tax=Adineta steineri TaxID=433720 RepID=A0A819U260_9BILA|nr:unnamed protein product [Adineta steineri]CAF3921619.1 unnamed protein product [Adineta steineri]CAF4082388.1 unnamed protein product [Adineta steineri]